MNDSDKSDKILRELEEQQCDLVMISLGKYFKEESMRQLEEWEEEIKATELPETLDYKLKKITEKYEKADIAVVRKRRRKSYLRVCSLMLAALVCVGGISLASSEAMRKSVYNIFFSPGDGNVEVSFKEANADVNIPDGLDVILYPNYLPKSYTLSDISNSGVYTNIIFKSYENDDEVKLRYVEQNLLLSLDSEQSKNRMISINGENAIIQNRDSKSNLVFKLDNYSIELSCNQKYIDENTIVQIAESIKKYSVNELKEQLQ